MVDNISNLVWLMDYVLTNYKKIDWRFEEVEKGGYLIRVTIKDGDGEKSVSYVTRNDLEGIIGVMKSILVN